MVKKKTAKSVSDKDVLQYMKKINRPYSATDIFNNLNETHSKSQIVKALDGLVANKDLISKTYGKTTIYSLNQDNVEESADTNTLRLEISELTEKLKTLEEENKELEKESLKFASKITTKEAIRLIQEYKNNNQELQDRLDKLKNNSVLIPPEKRKRTDHDFEYNRSVWKKRRNMFKNIFDTVTEHMPGDPNELRENLGVEEDVVPFNKNPLDD